jgi:hypothetical protein
MMTELQADNLTMMEDGKYLLLKCPTGGNNCYIRPNILTINTYHLPSLKDYQPVTQSSCQLRGP